MQAFITAQKFPNLFKKHPLSATPHIFGTLPDTITIYIYPRIEKIEKSKLQQDLTNENLELPDTICMDCENDQRKAASIDDD
jgi:hypothetical protein